MVFKDLKFKILTNKSLNLFNNVVNLSFNNIHIYLG